MSKQDDKPFVFNDETLLNSYGFSIPTKGISLKRFKSNPVMLDSHWNSTSNVIGKWKDIKKENGLLKGVPVFDSDDEKAAVIEGKVNRGFIKSCSMGVSFKSDDLKVVDGELQLTKCELFEVSIVAVPSNANAVRLYVDDSKVPLTEEEVQTLCLSVQSVNPKIEKQEENMKINLSNAALLALGMSADAKELSVGELNEKIIDLSAARDAAILQLEVKEEAEEDARIQGIALKVDNAVKAGKISAEKKQKFVDLGIANEEMLDETLAAIPAKKTLGSQVTPTGGNKDSEVKTKDDFQNLSLEEQLVFKADNPEQYAKLFTIK